MVTLHPEVFWHVKNHNYIRDPQKTSYQEFEPPKLRIFITTLNKSSIIRGTYQGSFLKA